MTEEENLAPVFVPSLAEILGQVESEKGSLLSESEIVQIRDKASCIMLSDDAFIEMSQTRGFIDINPENCWVDWHRVRGDFSDIAYQPRLILCVPGGKNFKKRAESVLESYQLDFQFHDADDRMAEAFEASDSKISPSIESTDLEKLKTHESVLYVLSPGLSAHAAPDACLQFLQLEGTCFKKMVSVSNWKAPE